MPIPLHNKSYRTNTIGSRCIHTDILHVDATDTKHTIDRSLLIAEHDGVQEGATLTPTSPITINTSYTSPTPKLKVTCGRVLLSFLVLIMKFNSQ